MWRSAPHPTSQRSIRARAITTAPRFETIARRSDMTEMAVAMLAIETSAVHRAGGAGGDRRGDVGYYLAGKGLAELKRAAAIGLRSGKVRPGLPEPWPCGAHCADAVIAAAILALGAWFLMKQPTAAIAALFLLATFALPALEAASALFRRSSLRLRRRPFCPATSSNPACRDPPDSGGHPVPAVGSRHGRGPGPQSRSSLSRQSGPGNLLRLAERSCRQQERIGGGRRGNNRLCRAEIEALAKKYAAAGPRRFFLLHRRPLFNPSEGAWMGWERKRGKLQELNMLLRGESDTTFARPIRSPQACNMS